MHFYLVLLASYLLGSIPCGKIVGRFKNIDIQKQGSGNIGFANSLRTMGWSPALIVLVGDMLKGFIPTYYAIHQFSLNQTLVIGLVAVVGHIINPWLKFKGGKGVATILGVSLALNYILALVSMAIWALVFSISKISSLASLITVLSFSLLAFFLGNNLFYFYLLLLIIVLITHRENLKNLVRKKEKQIL